MSKKKKRPQILGMINQIDWALLRLENQRDVYMYVRPNDEKADQIDYAMIQIRKYRDMLYQKL